MKIKFNKEEPRTQLLKQIGKECRTFRLSHDIKQLEVANMLHISAPAISEFEHGKSNSAVILLFYISLGYKPDVKEIMFYGKDEIYT